MSAPAADAKSIFGQALELEPAARPTYLDEACAGDPALRARIDGLLAAHGQAGEFMRRPVAAVAAEITAGYEPIAERPGTVIGPYKLMEQVGEGGMGLVFVAEQSTPVRRKVALKVIKPGMDSRQVIARFEAERQALAIMDHPNIAKVLAAGETASGRPYFVMELVKGVPVTEFCDHNRLAPRERLELFVQVCGAVQHAHQKGIIHRDIKPSNVLVSRHDTTPVVKVIDFGIAKALGQELTDKTLFTGVAQMIGTPLYMSPEQAGMSDLDVDTRSDIYSLGVLLYELLTGTTPLDKERLKGVGYDEIRRLVREDEPPRPSTRLSTVAELDTIAANRNSEPRRLSGEVRGELDWLAMKALEKDRNRRYETANAFAADVQRYLAGEAVLAVPPSAGYRLRKFVWRNRGPASAIALIAVALVGGIVGTTWGLVHAADARAETVAEEARKEVAQTEALLNKRFADERHFASLREQARAVRTSRQPGQRFKTLDVLRQATSLGRALELPGEKFNELRDTAIAALALPDLNPTGPWVPFPDDAVSIDFDEAHTLYARTDRQGNCTVRQVADGAEVHRLPGRGRIAVPQLSRDGRFLAIHAFTDKPPLLPVAVELWDLGPAAARKIWSVDKTSFSAFHPRLPQVALAYTDGAIGLFGLPDGRPISRLSPDTLTREVGIALHPTEPVVAVYSYFGRVVQLRDLGTGRVLAAIPQDFATSLGWSPDGRTLAVGSDVVVGGGRTRLYDRSSLRMVRTFEASTAVTGLSFNRAGDRLATIGWGGETNLFDLETGQKLFTTAPAAGYPRFSHDGRRLSGALRDGKVGFWEVGDGREYRTLVRQAVPGNAQSEQAAVSPDSRLAAAAMTDGIGLWDLVTGVELAFIPMPGGGGSKHVVFEASGALLTLGPTGVSRWPVTADPAAPERLTVGPPERLRLPIGHTLGQSRDGRVIVTCARAINVQQPHAGGWVLHTDRPDPPIRLDPGADIDWITISPDGRWVVTVVHVSGVVKIWDARDGRPVKQLAERGTWLVQFSPDGRWLSTDLDGGRLIAAGTWEPGPRLGGVGTFSPDGTVVAVPTGTQIRLVEAATGRTLATLEDPNLEPAVHPVFTPDGTRLLAHTNGKARGVRVWDLRLVRRQLAEMGLDWDAPPYPQAETGPARPLTVEVRTGLPTGPALSREEKARRNIESFRARHEANKNDPAACNNLAWALLTAPEPLRDVPAAVPLAERAVKLAPKNAVFANTLGVAYYRDGRYREAADVLRPNLDRQADKYLAFELYFLAMSHHRLGEAARARDYFAWAIRWEKTQSGLTPDEVEELKEFQAEAAVLLGLAAEVSPPPRERK
jgi:serine/threonine protein kinase/WD40 repeat protein